MHHSGNELNDATWRRGTLVAKSVLARLPFEGWVNPTNSV
jgi:hypothetical protein